MARCCSCEQVFSLHLGSDSSHRPTALTLKDSRQGAKPAKEEEQSLFLKKDQILRLCELGDFPRVPAVHSLAGGGSCDSFRGCSITTPGSC